jgi:hypothetical protein
MLHGCNIDPGRSSRLEDKPFHPDARRDGLPHLAAAPMARNSYRRRDQRSRSEGGPREADPLPSGGAESVRGIGKRPNEGRPIEAHRDGPVPIRREPDAAHMPLMFREHL